MNGPAFLSLISGIVFGAGLVVSGMADPKRVRDFLDITGAFDPTLAFVMGGAVTVMVIVWRVQNRMRSPLATEKFDLYPDSLKTRKTVALKCFWDSTWLYDSWWFS